MPGFPFDFLPPPSYSPPAPNLYAPIPPAVSVGVVSSMGVVSELNGITSLSLIGIDVEGDLTK